MKTRAIVCAAAALLLMRCGGVGEETTEPSLGTMVAAIGGASTNVALGKPVTLSGGSFFAGGWGGGQTVDAGTLVDGVFLPRSAQWDQGPIWWDGHDGVNRALTIDLGGRFWIDGLILQADDNDQYRVSARDPGGAWTLIWTAPAPGGWGMQTRPNPGDNTARYALPAHVLADQLRVEGDFSYTDRYFSVSELQAFGRAADPVVWLKLDGDAKNAVPGGPDGVPADITFDAGRINQAAGFERASSAIEVPAIPDLGASGITVSAWVRPDKYDDHQQTVANQWDGRSAANSWYLGMHRTGRASSWVWRVRNAAGTELEITAPAAPVVLPSGHQPQGSWTHLAATCDATGRMALYVNGVAVRMAQGPAGAPQPSSLSISVGARPNGDRFRGAVDDLRIWPSALLPAEVETLAREVWPNAESYANSDDWLAQHHRDLRYLNPTVLALNFVTGIDGGSQVEGVAAGLSEGSRYHGYQFTSGGPEVALRPDVHLVDLSAATCLAPGGGEYNGGPACATTWDAGAQHNGACYPRRPECTNLQMCDTLGTVRYSALFSQEYADLYGIRDSTGRALPLCELINTGRVHEVWMVGAVQGGTACDVKGLEVVEVKPKYAEDGGKLSPLELEWEAGNGSYNWLYGDESAEILAQPGCANLSRSVRILFIQQDLPPAQAIHSLGHGTESTSQRGVIPSFSRYFSEYAGFDLRGRSGAGFDRWYDFCRDSLPGTCSIGYTPGGAADSVHAEWHDDTGALVDTADLSSYVASCGSVHYPVNARTYYDWDNPDTVASTCEDYRLGSNGGADAVRRTGSDRWRTLGSSIPNADVQLGWQIYWRQNMPGPNSPAKDDAGTPMLWWTPFSYY